MVSRNEERAVRDMGRTALEKAAKAALDTVPPGISRRFATVTKLYGNGTCDVDMGSATSPQPMLGLRMTAGCMGVSVGSRVIVDTVSHVSLVTGVLASDNLPYVRDAVQNPQYQLSLYANATVKQANGFYVDLFNDAEYRAIVGRSFKFDTDVVLAMNGDYSANANTIDGVIFRKNENIITCHINDQTTGLIRINYVIVARR